MEIRLVSKSEDQTQAIGGHLLALVPEGGVICLEGPLAAGKTSLTKGLAKALGIERAIKSPTYTIARQYPVSGHPAIQELIHVDVYRLEDDPYDTVDFDGFIGSGILTVIEWASLIEDYLPKSYLKVTLTPLEASNQRSVTIQATADLAQALKELEIKLTDSSQI